ncbi:ATPase, T2SS/T4P/T4SS family [uncultured Ruegeria sp.]|uniref:ATPase, T2SS/T4P/T4SS family n=1 Tax=uncultured Ruegeria sp. TaxID=259304 RepID=UPI002610422F|nr:ATPase, T2SS/T4P/T4SS family [uncultured Ruegeria sp.]
MLDLKRLLGNFYSALEDDSVVEISLNPSGDVFVEHFGAPASAVGQMPTAMAERFIRSCATATNALIDKSAPIYSGRIPGTAHRIEAILSPLADGPMFSIRRHRNHVFPLSEFAPDERLQEEIIGAIAAKKNIVIAGSTGSGKTTLTNSCLSCLSEVAPDTRLLVLEDTPELNSSLANLVPLHSTHNVSLDRLLVSALRLAPDRIVLGEVRTGIVLMTLLKAWNTGHPGGVTTIHANSAADVLARMQTLTEEVSVGDQTRQILSSLDLVLFVARGTSGSRITQVGRAVPCDDPQTPFKLEFNHVENP